MSKVLKLHMSSGPDIVSEPFDMPEPLYMHNILINTMNGSKISIAIYSTSSVAFNYSTLVSYLRNNNCTQELQFYPANGILVNTSIQATTIAYGIIARYINSIWVLCAVYGYSSQFSKLRALEEDSTAIDDTIQLVN